VAPFISVRRVDAEDQKETRANLIRCSFTVGTACQPRKHSWIDAINHENM